MSTGLLPALQEILPHITSLVVTVSGFVRENPQLVATIGTIAVGALAFGQIASAAMSFAGVLFPLVGGLVSMAGSIGTFAAGLMSSLLPALGAAITAAWSFTAALLANPITWIVIAIVAAAALIYIYWEPISEFFAWLWDGISSGFLAAWAVLEGAWDAAVSFFTGIFGEIKSAFQDSFVGGIFTALKMLNPMYWIVRAFGAIQPYLVALWPKLRDGAIDGLKAMGAAFLSLGAWIWEALQALPGKLWSWTTSLFTLLKDAAIAGIRLQVEGWKMLGSWVLDALVALPGKLVAFWQGVGATIAGWVSNFGQVIWSGITKDVDRVKSWLSSFSLRDAGANIVRTIAEGIASAAGSAYEAMQKVVQKVRNLLPFSPAKEGPLRDLHRVKLVETVAEAVRPTPLVQAMSGAAAAAMVAMQSVPPPSEPVPIPASIRSVSAERGSAAMSSSGAGAAPIILNVTLSFGGGDVRANADYFERWLSTPGNPARLARRLKEEARIDSRRGLT